MSQQLHQIDQEYLQFAAKELNGIKQRSYAYMQIHSGHRVLDVGCGLGTDTIFLAQLVGSTGLVVGIDINADMIARSEGLSAKAGISSWVTNEQADANSLPLRSAYFDSCRSERLFQHLIDPEPALAEMIRVTKSGGWVVVLDVDWGTLSIDTNEIDSERRLSRFRAEYSVSNGYSGRKLYRQIKTHGLTDISIEIFPTYVTSYAFARQAFRLDVTDEEAHREGFLTKDELKYWRSSLERADSEDIFFANVNLVLVAGRVS